MMEEINESTIWPFIETKVRKLLSEVLEPPMHRLGITETAHKKILKTHKKIKTKLGSIKTLYDSLASRIPNTEKINDLLVENSLKMISSEFETKKDTEQLSEQVSLLSNKFESFNSHIESILSQMSFFSQELKGSRQDFWEIKKNLERDFELQWQKFQESLEEREKTHEAYREKCAKVEKKVELIEESLCHAEVLGRRNEVKLEEVKKWIEEIKEIAKRTRKELEAEIRNIKHEVYSLEDRALQRIDEYKSEISEKINEGNSKMMENQNLLIYEWLEFTLIEPRYKKKLSEFKKRPKSYCLPIESQANFQHSPRNVENSTKKLVKSKSLSAFNLLSPVSLKRNTSEKAFSSFSRNSFSKLNILTQKSLKLVSTSLPTISFYENFNNPSINRLENSLFRSHPLVKIWQRPQNSDEIEEILNYSSMITELPKIPKNLAEIKPRVYENSLRSSKKLKTVTRHSHENKGNSDFSDFEMLIEDIQSQIELVKQEIEMIHSAQSNSESKLLQSIAGISLSLTDNAKISEQRALKIEDQIQNSLKPWVLLSISSSFQSAINDICTIREQVYEKMAEIEKTHKELDMNLRQSVKEFNLYVSSRKRELHDVMHSIKYQEKVSKNHQEKFFDISSKLSNLGKSIENIKEACFLTNVLLKQDEIDKNSMSLMACKGPKDVKKQKGNKKGPISLDRNCISCTYGLPQILPAFKIACLTYSSSPISLNNQMVGRDEVLDKQANLLRKVENQYEELSFEIEETRKRALTPELPKINIKIR